MQLGHVAECDSRWSRATDSHIRAMKARQPQPKRLIVIQPELHRYRQELYRQLAQHFDIVLTAQDKGTAEHLRENIRFFPSRIKSLSPLPFAWQSPLSILAEIRRGDVVLMNSNPRVISNFWIYIVSRLKGARIVFWNHGRTGGSPRWRSRIRYLWERCADRNLLYYKEEIPYAEQMGIQPGRLYATGNTINTTLIEAAIDKISSEQLAQFKASHHLTDKKVILFIGRVTQKAGFPLLLEAFALASLKDPALVLVIIGADEQIKSTHPLLNDPSIRDKVIFAGKLFEEDQLAPWFLSAQVLFYPGSVGLSLVHAFAYGLPAVVHSDAHTHMPEFVLFEENSNGLSFKKDSAADAADKLLAILGDQARLKAMSEAAKALVFSHYRIEQMAMRIQQAVTFSDQEPT